ncbi:hypothetical protein [Amycolatopsis saalfeldensis]|uniref:Uncharacterized protein n=1 Tax=Amycolatopsis saalfeldensis TaxID=394193 RepID=A0A1H8YPM1_9PSEU|nr:hypothetical protein [Amycolatopsis saalfeldensis]SEP54165.1 hypothetical protein SAMN04489732_13819 [Amycolatopsis saalfeldensis]
MTDDSDGRKTRSDLREQFAREVVLDQRVAAETAYALAFRYRNEDVDGERRFDIAKVWATRAVELLDGLPADQLDDVAATRPSVGGIAIPDLFHSGIVRERLCDVLL